MGTLDENEPNEPAAPGVAAVMPPILPILRLARTYLDDPAWIAARPRYAPERLVARALVLACRVAGRDTPATRRAIGTAFQQAPGWWRLAVRSQLVDTLADWRWLLDTAIDPPLVPQRRVWATPVGSVEWRAALYGRAAGTWIAVDGTPRRPVFATRVAAFRWLRAQAEAAL